MASTTLARIHSYFKWPMYYVYYESISADTYYFALSVAIPSQIISFVAANAVSFKLNAFLVYVYINFWIWAKKIVRVKTGVVAYKDPG
jgi:hypothetical protein